MNKLCLALAALLLLPLVISAQPNRVSDGYNEILAVVDGEPITYQDVIGRLDLAAEVRTMREVRRIADSVSDKEIERGLVYNQLDVFIVNRLLLGEAKKVNIDSNIKESDVRNAIARERALLGIAEGDEVKWAMYLQQKYGQTPSEYRERKRTDIIQNQMLYLMAGSNGSLPTEFPLSVYFPLSVSPKAIRKAFEADRDQYKFARKIDYRVLKLVFQSDTELGDRKKLYAALLDCQTRVRKGESLESASDGLGLLKEQMNLPGLNLIVGERTKIDNDEGLDPTLYQLVLSLPVTGGVSDIGSAPETDDKGTKFEGYMFIQLFSKEEGDARRFDDPKVQTTISQMLYNRALQENMAKVQQALLKRAVIVPDRLIAR